MIYIFYLKTNVMIYINNKKEHIFREILAILIYETQFHSKLMWQQLIDN